MSNVSFNFSGKRALVTGAGRGIGRELAKALSKAGAETFALDKDDENLQSLVSEIESIHPVCVDLENWKSTRNAIESIGHVDFLVNNAGFATSPTQLLDADEDSIDKTFDVNVKAATNISQVIAKRMIEIKRPGSIVNISSAVSTRVVAGAGIYCSTKGALDQLTRTMALEFGPHQIRVNSVRPGLVLTEMSKNLHSDEKFATALLQRIPLERFSETSDIIGPRFVFISTATSDIIETSDIVGPVLFLLSDNASMINGAFLSVDGGESIT